MPMKSCSSLRKSASSKRIRRWVGLLLGSAMAVQYKQDHVFRACVNLQLVMGLNYL